MKLARPDIRHPRIVLAGSADGDDAGLVAHCALRGLHAHWLAWDDPVTLTADLVILREGGDHAEFLAWTRRVPNLLNAPEVVAWNTGRASSARSRRCGRARTGAVVRQALRPAPHWCFSAASNRTHSSRRPRSMPISSCGTSARPRLQAAADHIGIATDELLYARADVIGEPGKAKLVELNLVDPSLGWRLLSDDARGDAQRQFALCVESALDRLGLGPLSHRGP